MHILYLSCQTQKSKFLNFFQYLLFRLCETGQWSVSLSAFLSVSVYILAFKLCRPGKQAPAGNYMCPQLTNTWPQCFLVANGHTDGQTDQPFYRDARTPFKKR